MSRVAPMLLLLPGQFLTGAARRPGMVSQLLGLTRTAAASVVRCQQQSTQSPRSARPCTPLALPPAPALPASQLLCGSLCPHMPHQAARCCLPKSCRHLPPAPHHSAGPSCWHTMTLRRTPFPQLTGAQSRARVTYQWLALAASSRCTASQLPPYMPALHLLVCTSPASCLTASLLLPWTALRRTLSHTTASLGLGVSTP
ncbi:hypothetical protein V8C86DRAFT_2458793 [Haematococcus lacustris]